MDKKVTTVPHAPTAPAQEICLSETREQLGPFVLKQGRDCFPLGGDTLALGQFAPLRPRWRVADFGCGGGALGLLLLGREATLSLVGVELEPSAAGFARQNFAATGLNATVLWGDLRERNLLPAGGFDLVVSNPPWFAQGRGASGGAARCEETCTLAELCAAASSALKNGGQFALVHRPERLAELFAALAAAKLEPKRLQLVQHSPTAVPSAVLVQAARQGKAGLNILPPLILGAN